MIKIGSKVRLNSQHGEVIDKKGDTLVLQIGKQIKEVYIYEVSEIHPYAPSSTPKPAPEVKRYTCNPTEMKGEFEKFLDELKNDLYRKSCTPPSSIHYGFQPFQINQETYKPYKYNNRVAHNEPVKKQGGFNMKLNIKDLFKIEKTNGEVALTMDGQIAVQRRNGDYVSVNADGTVTNNLSLALTGAEKFIMILPTPVVAVGDVIKNKGAFVKVLRVEENKLRGVNFETGTGTTIQKETNILGLNFFQKVTSIMSLGGAQGAGVNPMMLLALSDQDEKEIDPMTLMLLSGSFNQGAQTGSFNPLMLLALGDDVDPMTLMMMSGGLGGVAGSSTNGINPMLLMALAGDKEDTYDRYGAKKKNKIDPMMMMLMSGGLGNAFGQVAQPVVTPITTPVVEEDEKDKE